MIRKAAAITNLTDARFFASYGVDYIGFCFDPLSPDYISPQQALAIKGWLHNVKIVAEFANQDTENMKGIIAFLQPHIIEIRYPAVPDFQVGLPVSIQCMVKEVNSLPAIDYVYVLLADYQGETLPDKALQYMADISHGNFDYLSKGISAVQVRGGKEQETGVKEYDALVTIMESLATR
jgi:phosphoribosylanthranilate isomerase